MRARRLLLLVVLPLAGAAAWWALQLWVYEDIHHHALKLLLFVPLALPTLITLATTLRDRPPRTVALWTAYSASMTVLFAILVVLVLLAIFFATDPDTGCPDHRIYC